MCEEVINLATQVQQVYYTMDSNFIDKVRSPTEVNQLLILHITYPTDNPPNHNTTNNQYYIRSYNINTTRQHTMIVSLSEKMSPFCCLIAHSDTLYILDMYMYWLCPYVSV